MAFSVETYSIFMKRIRSYVSVGIAGFEVKEIGGVTNLTITLADGSVVNLPLEGILTKQQRDDLVKAILEANNYTDNLIKKYIKH